MQASIDLRLARHGAILLLLGLLEGFAITRFHNRGAGDAAHLVGVFGGFGMIALGALWPALNLTRFWSNAGVWITAVAMYANWLGCVLLGLGGGPAMQGSQVAGSPLLWAARIVLFPAVWLSLLFTLIVLVGLFRRAAPAPERDDERFHNQAMDM